jgi:hypothetical protein
VLLAPLLYLLLTLAWCWPLPLHLANRFTHDPGDPLLVTYLIWWNAHAIPLTKTWWDAPFFWPMPDALALTEHLAGLSPFTTPVQWLGGSPLLAYNLVLIASTWWTLLATHALVRRLTGDTVAAACAAVAFAFAPYRIAQMGHLQLYACWGMPLCLLAMHAYHEDGRRRWLAVFGVSWLLLALTNAYSLFFFPLLLAAWAAWFTPWRTAARRTLALAAAWVLCSLPLLPLLFHYYQAQQRLGVGRTRGEMMFYSAGWREFFSAAPNLLFWKTPEPSTTEGYLFPGLTVSVLVAAALLRPARDRVFWFYVLGAVTTAWFCTGPSATGLSLASLLHPYDLLLWLPGFNGIRVPPRFFMITALCLAVAAGLAVARFRAPRRWRALMTTAVFAGLIVDGTISGMPLGRPPGDLGALPRGARMLALPMDDSALAVTTLYRSMAPRLRVVNGYAGYIPSPAVMIDWALRRHDPSILRELRRGHPLYVLVGGGEQADQWTAFMEAQHDARLIRITSGGGLYEMSPAPYEAPLVVGAALAPSAVDVRGEWIVADLGRAASVRAVDLRTRGHVVKLPGVVRIETSLDGVTWTLAAEQPPGGLALIGALSDPRVIPLRIAVPYVQARFVRINAPFFGAAAITIYAP